MVTFRLPSGSTGSASSPSSASGRIDCEKSRFGSAAAAADVPPSAALPPLSIVDEKPMPPPTPEPMPEPMPPMTEADEPPSLPRPPCEALAVLRRDAPIERRPSCPSSDHPRLYGGSSWEPTAEERVELKVAVRAADAVSGGMAAMLDCERGE